jgi:hypothetical protein
MPGPAPKPNRRRRNAPARGEITPTQGVGWQHGDVPPPPDGLLDISRWAWDTWFASWFAANWHPEDLPVLRQVIKVYDLVERGGSKATDRTQLHVWFRAYGITPDGQIALRWARPKEVPSSPSQPSSADPYAHLRIVGE